MAGKAKYLMIASMDVDPEHEAIFNEVYDKEHVPNLSKVPGVVGITRYKRGTLTMNIGGERKTIEIPNEPTFTAIYELENPEVLTSPAWDKAIEEGRWPGQVRPHTKNRRHVLAENDGLGSAERARLKQICRLASSSVLFCFARIFFSSSPIDSA